MLSKVFQINCKEGFHLRPSQVLTETAASFQSDITLITQENESADAKSILGLMCLGLATGETVTVEVSGQDEKAAMAAIEELFLTNFHE